MWKGKRLEENMMGERGQGELGWENGNFGKENGTGNLEWEWEKLANGKENGEKGKEGWGEEQGPRARGKGQGAKGKGPKDQGMFEEAWGWERGREQRKIRKNGDGKGGMGIEWRNDDEHGTGKGRDKYGEGEMGT